VKDLSDSVTTSLKRFRGGIATYHEVLDNQRSLLSAQLTLAQDRGNEFQILVMGDIRRRPYASLRARHTNCINPRCRRLHRGEWRLRTKVESSAVRIGVHHE
jgi:hypothetical protein